MVDQLDVFLSVSIYILFCKSLLEISPAIAGLIKQSRQNNKN